MRKRLAMDAPNQNFLPPHTGGDGGSPSSGREADAAFFGLSTHVYV